MSITTTPSILYRARQHQTARPARMPVKSYPLPEAAPESVRLAAYALAQEFEMEQASFPPGPRNTPSTAAVFTGIGDANAILTRLSPPNNTAAGCGRFTADFQIVPASWDDYSKQIPFTFADFPGYTLSAGVRNSFTDNVIVRERHDYFVLDPDGVLNGGSPPGAGVHAGTVNDSAGTPVNIVATLADIPRVAKSNFYCPASGVWARTNSLVRAGGQVIGSSLFLETLPTKESMVTMIANALASGWSTTVWGGSNVVTGQGQLVVQDAAVTEFAGLIFDRVTMFVLCK